MFKRCQVVMLPTNEKALNSILLNPSTNKIELSKGYLAKEYQKAGYNTFYLYIISDEEIQIDDWACHKNDKYRKEFPNDKDLIIQCNKSNKESIQEHWRKILATTDTLSILIDDNCLAKESPIGKLYDYLPQPSQSFIEKFVEEYNKGNIINDVLVEFEPDGSEQQMYQDRLGDEFVTSWKPKVSRDNTITIRKVKDTWSKEEVIDLLYQSYSLGLNSDRSEIPEMNKLDKWIEENL